MYLSWMLPWYQSMYHFMPILNVEYCLVSTIYQIFVDIEYWILPWYQSMSYFLWILNIEYCSGINPYHIDHISNTGHWTSNIEPPDFPWEATLSSRWWLPSVACVANIISYLNIEYWIFLNIFQVVASLCCLCRHRLRHLASTCTVAARWTFLPFWQG